MGWIRKGRKSADFEQKAWAIAHAFEHGGFWQVLEIAPNSLKRLQIPSKIISDSLRDLLCRFGVNSQGSKIGRFWAKSLGYSPCFWTWRILASPGNRSKLSETPPNPFQNYFWLLAGLVMSIWGEFAKGRKLADFEQKAWAIAHAFEHGGFWQVLEIAPNSLKRLPNPFQNYFWLFAGLVMSIWGEFARVENRPILSKKPGL